MFKHVTGAVERIAFQASSPLAKEMIELCREVQAKALMQMPQGAPVNVKRLSRDMNGFSDFSTKAKKLIKDRTGITVKLMAVVPADGHALALMIPQFSKESKILSTDAEAAMARIHGQQMQPPPRLSSIFRKLNAGLDLKSGKLDSQFSDMYAISIILSSEMLISGAMGVEGLSPEEVAAVILHEVGHGITLAENFQNLFYRATEARDSFSLLTAKLETPEEHINFIDDVLEVTKTIPDKSRKVAYQEVLESSQETSDTPRKTIVASHVGLDIIIGQLIHAADIGRLLGRQQNSRIMIALGREVKTSDTLNTGRNLSVSERIADEYVSRHGLGRPLASGLQKLYAQPLNKNTAGSNISAAGALYALNNINFGITNVLTALLPNQMDIPGVTPYDDPIVRLELLIQNNMSIFKSNNLPEGIKQTWLRETEELIKDLRATKDERWPIKSGKVLWSTLRRVSKEATITGGLINANLQADYAQLQTITRGLIRNQLYFRAAQVKELIDKRRS